MRFSNYWAGTRRLAIIFFKNAEDDLGDRSFSGLVKFTENSPNFSLKNQKTILICS